ncbi:rRNA pseudouridine synthase [Aurantibacter crassamenti]|uniref:pseudouridine synthase n=1 Tax=Aurantibacter crassamenti TaxID=1837375 RepID=UPI001939E14C|nr:pseudouridine synthase [Aurantibacter crassamenti]MBM1104741.1 rRNA pseudouridine synthase [Aurantibacter crassamenti]
MGKSDSSQNKKSSGKHVGNFRKKNFSKPRAQGNAAPVAKQPSNPDLVRLNKYVSNSGVCSRRDADIYISAGSVTVNGKTITEMGYKVKLTDEVKFDGRLLNPVKKEYVLLNKPKDFTTTVRDTRGRRNVSGLISNASKTPLLPVDKMDKEATGLLLFTNDGDLTKRLKSPKNGLRKIYHVVLNKDLRSADMKKIQEGITLEEKPVRVQEISFIENAPKREVGIEIYSTKNKIVERIFEHLDYEVVKIDRVSYAGLTKKDLPRGHWRYLTDQEIVNLGMLK